MLVIVAGLALFTVLLTIGLVRTGGSPAMLPKAQAQGAREGRTSSELTSSRLDAREIGSSTVNFVWPGEVFGGGIHDLCFNVTVESPGLEYLDRFEVDLPDAWTVNEVYPMAASSDCPTSSISGWEAANLIYWQTDVEELPSYCGAWFNGVYDFCTNVTVPSCTGSPWSLPWTIFGDGWEDPPHQVSGLTDLLTCQQLELVLSPSVLEIDGCQEADMPFLLWLRNETGTDGTFDMAYSVSTGNASLVGPDSLYVPDGVEQEFECHIQPDGCLSDGEQILATVEASGAGVTATAVITYTIRDWETCPKCPPLICLPIVNRNHE
jgi:hypothetical protein